MPNFYIYYLLLYIKGTLIVIYNVKNRIQINIYYKI